MENLVPRLSVSQKYLYLYGMDIRLFSVNQLDKLFFSAMIDSSL